MRVRSGIVLSALALSLLGIPTLTFPCTSFSFDGAGQLLFGKNYDWNLDHGLLIVNKRGVARMAAPELGRVGEPARWTTRYGSVTFNQYGRNTPSGGINEAGVVVELMMLKGTIYPSPDTRPVVGALEWIQYQLDTASAVADVIASDRAIRIGGVVPLHYLVADRAGKVAAIEFLDGRMVASAGEQLPARALTNSSYRDSLAFLQMNRGDLAMRGNDSLTRFTLASRRASAFHGSNAQEALPYAFATLGMVGRPLTQWSIVYDIKGRRIHFKTRRHPAIRSVSLDGIDFACQSPVLALDLNAPGLGVVDTLLIPLTAEANLRTMRASYAETTRVADTTESDLRDRASHAELDRCQVNQQP